MFENLRSRDTPLFIDVSHHKGREAVILRNIKEISYEEIADMLGCKVGTIKSRIARGRELLRAELELD